MTPGEHEGPVIRAALRVPRVPADEVVERWHPSLGYRVFAVLIALVCLVIGGLALSAPASPSDAVWAGATLVVGPIVAWLMFGRPYLVLTRHQLLVQNAIFGFELPLAAIANTRTSGWGLVLEVRGRLRPVFAMAVPANNFDAFMGRQGRADKVAGIVERAARSSQGDVTEP